MNPGIRKEAEKRFTPHFFVHLYQGAASGATQHVHHTDEVRQGQQRRDPHRSWRDGRRRNRISRRQGGVPGCGRRHARRSQQTRSDSGRQEGAHEGARPDHMASLYSGRRSWSTDDRLHRGRIAFRSKADCGSGCCIFRRGTCLQRVPREGRRADRREEGREAPGRHRPEADGREAAQGWSGDHHGQGQRPLLRVVHREAFPV
jgi:hypothetical protein